MQEIKTVEAKKHEEAEFQIGDMLGIALTLVVLGIGVSYGLSILGDIRDDMTTNSAEYNSSQFAIAGISKLPEKLPLIVTVIVAAIVIGVLLRYMMVKTSA